MKLVTGIARTTSLQHVVQRLEDIGVKGLTISEIKGLEHAATGLAGDGLVAVSPVDYAVRIRNREGLK